MLNNVVNAKYDTVKQLSPSENKNLILQNKPLIDSQGYAYY